MAIDREKAEVYRLMADIIAKMMLVIAVTIVFLVMSGFLLWKPNTYFAVVDSVLGFTMYKVIAHYFPRKGGNDLPKKLPRPRAKKTPTLPPSETE